MSKNPTYGPNQAGIGEQCSNGPWLEDYTCPGCYKDVEDIDAKECSECGAPIKCFKEMRPYAVCEIRDVEEEDQDEESD